MMHLKLSYKIIIVIFTSSILMLSIMLFFGFKFSKDTVEQQISKLMQDKYLDVLKQVDTLIAGYITQINIISTDQSLSKAIIDYKKNQNNINIDVRNKLSNLLIYSGPWDDLLLLDERAAPIAVSSIHTNNKLPDIYLEEMSVVSKTNIEHSSCTDVFDVDGMKILSCISSIKTINEGKETIIGYIVGRVAIRSIEDILSNTSPNNILFRADGYPILKNIDTNKESLVKNVDLANFSGFSNSAITSVSGINYMITMARERGVPGYMGNNWILVNVSDVSLYISDGEKNINKIIYIAAIALIFISILITLFLRKIITKPVNKLQVAATFISEGDFNQKLDISSNDEIGDLSLAFTKMSNQLKDLYASLEDRVKDKTHELEIKIKELEESKETSEKAIKDIEEAEEKMAVKNKQVEGAFEEVQRFARIADKERLTYSLLISSIGEAVVVVNSDGEISVSNAVCAQMLSIDVKALEGISIFNIFELFTAEGKNIDIDELGKILSEDKLYSFKYWILKRKSDNAQYTISGVIAPLVDNRSDGIVRGMIFTFRDVINEKMLDDARIGFISTASHQLRTPLTSMKWFTEMLHDGDAGDINEEQKHFVERIGEGVDRMVGLVNMLLQIARVEAGRTAIVPTPVILKEIINGVAKTIEVDLMAHHQNIKIISDPIDFPVISLDRDYIWQVVQNLLTNAQRYSFDNTTIEAELKIEDSFAIISIKDKGIGIPDSAKARLFEKFYRAENALAKVPSGTGLGLSLVKMLVEEIGGNLSFESTEGVGSTFYVKIPLEGMKARAGDVTLSV